MLRTIPIIVVLTARTSSASPAELALGETNLQLLRRADLFDDAPTDPMWRAAAFAQVVGGGDGGGSLGVGAALATSGIGCSLVDVSAQGRLRPFHAVDDEPVDDDLLGGDARYSICVSKIFLSATFDGHRSAGLSPALGARASLWRRRYSSEFDRISIGFGELFWDDESARHTIMPMTIGHGAITQTDGIETRTIKELQFDIGVYRYRKLGTRSETVVDAIALVSGGMKAGSTNAGGVASAFYPAMLRYESPSVFASVRAGWGFTGGYIKASGSTSVDGEQVSEWSETIDSEGLPSLTTHVGDATFGVRMPAYRAELSATASRAFYPTFDGNLALEDRIAASLSTGIMRWIGTSERPLDVKLSPFVARTQTWTREAGDGRDRSYGATLQAGRELSRVLRVDGIGELGRSPYARIGEGGRAPASTFGGQLLVALTARTSR